ncbi:MAG: hypothetical protein KC910_13870 [Candidatus Eremiobacteraeota bacterium]|nr:hypothetical protein [Candidatus Eremiobacteraeota bacterium]
MTYEQELDAWLGMVVARAEQSPLAHESWIRDGLEGLGALKDDLAQEPTALAHAELLWHTERFLETLSAEEGPTAFAWLNEPLRPLARYLEGQELDCNLEPLLENACLQLASRQAEPQFQQALTTLHRWSQGHANLDGLELRQLVALIVEQANQNHDHLAAMDLQTLVLTLQGFDLEDPEWGEYLSYITHQLEAWSEEFYGLADRLPAARSQTVHELLQKIYSAVEQLHELPDEAEEAELHQLVGQLVAEWNEAHHDLLADTIGHRPEEDTFLHLHNLCQLVAGWEEGTVEQAVLEAELRLQQQRFEQVSPQLAPLLERQARDLWQEAREALTSLSAQVASQGRSAYHSCESYCSALAALAQRLQAEGAAT